MHLSWEVDAVLALQSARWLDEPMHWITALGDPKHIVGLVTPFVFWMLLATSATPSKHADVGPRTLLAATIADLSNALIKFVLAGDRPYWVHDDVREGPLTCESSYGLPSGHVMVSTAAVVALASHSGSRVVVWLARTFLFLVAVSRVHIGAHFPTQTVAGLVLGFAACAAAARAWPDGSTAYLASFRGTRSRRGDRGRGVAPWPLWIGEAPLGTGQGSRTGAARGGAWALPFSLCAATGIAAAALTQAAMHAELALLEWVTGADPLHSVILARDGCGGDGAVHNTTAPDVGVARDAGLLCASALSAAAAVAGAHSIAYRPGWKTSILNRAGPFGRAAVVIVASIALQFAMRFASTSGTAADAFALYVTFGLVTLFAVPRLILPPMATPL